MVRWLSWYHVHLHPAAGRLYFRHVIKRNFRAGPADPVKVDEALKTFRVFASVLNAHLETRSMLVDDALTIADFTVSAPLPYADNMSLPLDDFPALARWRDRLAAIPRLAREKPLAHRESGYAERLAIAKTTP